MTTKTGEGLAQYALAQLGRPYWWGTFGQTASAALLAQKRAQYPEYYTADDFKSQFGQRVHDCVGLIKGYLWSETPKSTPVYCAEQDVAVSGLYRSCVRRGDIARMPQITGACVFMEGLGHVGVYVGDGYVVEASGHAKGVVRTRLKDRGWALWGLPGWISYGDAPADWAQGAAVAAGTEKNSTAVQLPLLRQGAGFLVGLRGGWGLRNLHEACGVGVPARARAGRGRRCRSKHMVKADRRMNGDGRRTCAQNRAR